MTIVFDGGTINLQLRKLSKKERGQPARTIAKQASATIPHSLIKHVQSSKEFLNSLKDDTRDHVIEIQKAVTKLQNEIEYLLNNYDPDSIENELKYFEQSSLTEDELCLIIEYINFISKGYY